MFKKIVYIILILFLAYGFGYSEQGKVKIILENGYYYTQLETGEKYEIVKHHEPWAFNKVVISPDEKYVAYTKSNGLGLEQVGRDIYYCKVDGSERTFLHKFESDVDTLLWSSDEEINFIFVLSLDCERGFGGIQIINLKSKDIIFTCSGDSLEKIQGTDCYQIFCNGKPVQQGKRYGKPVEKGRERICLEELLDIKEHDSLNVRFYTSWSESDIYISTQREPVLKLSDLPTLAEQIDEKFRDFTRNRYFYVSHIFPTPENNIIAFIGEVVENRYFFGVFEVERRKLLLFDCCKGLIYLNTIWSPDGIRIALFTRDPWEDSIMFYELIEEDKMVPIKVKHLGHRRALEPKWSEDSRKFYFSYELGNQKVEEQIDLPK